jgi:leader peptidase (prepilin peptidase)/N-methyltransferase
MTALYAGLFGLALGSFINAAIDRLPRRQPMGGRSRCDACGHALRPWELVPVVSYVALRGRCGSCRAPIGVRTPLVEGTGAVTLAVLCSAAGTPAAAAVAAITVALVALAGAALSGRRVDA